MLSTRSRIAMIAATVLGMSSSLPAMMPTGRVQAATHGAPRRRHGSLRYPFSSTRQHDRHAERQYMVVVNGFEIMNTVRRGGSAKHVGELRNFPTGTHDDQIDGWMREIPPVGFQPEVRFGTHRADGSVEWGDAHRCDHIGLKSLITPAFGGPV